MSGIPVSIPPVCFDGLVSVLSGMSGGEYQQYSRSLGRVFWGLFMERDRERDESVG